MKVLEDLSSKHNFLYPLLVYKRRMCTKRKDRTYGFFNIKIEYLIYWLDLIYKFVEQTFQRRCVTHKIKYIHFKIKKKQMSKWHEKESSSNRSTRVPEDWRNSDNVKESEMLSRSGWHLFIMHKLFTYNNLCTKRRKSF